MKLTLKRNLLKLLSLINDVIYGLQIDVFEDQMDRRTYFMFFIRHLTEYTLDECISVAERFGNCLAEFPK